MHSHQPHFFLRCETQEKEDRGEWKFVLTAADGSATLEACDQEADVRGERLELLAVVRALESLDQPSLVTLQAGARAVRRILAEGLDEWRRNGWMWESYGELTPIKNRDLWQRLDRAMTYHKFETRRVFRMDWGHEFGDSRDSTAASAETATTNAEESAGDSPCPETSTATSRWKHGWHRMRRRLRDRVDGLTLSCAQLGSPIVNTSWVN